MKAVILAGGLGTRLRPLTYTTPKPMLPIANRPILDHIIDRLMGAGIDEAIVTANYLSKQIKEHVKTAGYPIPVEVVEEKKPLGTAGSVRNVKDMITENFLVLQGDSVSSLDLREHTRLHRGVATISLTKVENPNEYGIAELGKSGRIKRFLEKPGPGECFSNLANTGTYSFDYGTLDYMPRGRSDFSLDVFPSLLAGKKPIYGIVQEGYWKDVGSIANYFSCNKHLLERFPKGGVMTRALVDKSAKLVPPYVIGEGAQVGPDALIGPNTAIGSHCKIGAGTSVSGAILHDSVKVGANCRIDDCIIGDNCEISDGAFVASRAVLGSGCTIEGKAGVTSGSVIGPMVKVNASTRVSGVLSPNIEKMEKVSLMLNKIPVFKKLERDELQVCMALVEFGELGKEALGKVSKMPSEQVDRSLTRLEKQGIIRAGEGEFSLLYDDPEKIYEWVKKRLL